MPPESLKLRRARLEGVIDVLRATYPDAGCELDYRSPLELLVATILSAQCSDQQVNRVTAGLFNKYRSAADYANATPMELEEDLRRIGLFRNKARSLRACGRRLAEFHGGEVPDDMEALIRLEGVGRKTANVVLGNAFGRSEGVVVDTHVTRLAGRLGLTREQHPERIERDLMRLVPPEQWTIFSHWLIWHGRRRCRARNPDCEGCELKVLCPAAARGGEVRAVRPRARKPRAS